VPEPDCPVVGVCPLGVWADNPTASAADIIVPKIN
jgi:hypothetical protein